jgi:small ligand-binding sensory domain FIST
MPNLAASRLILAPYSEQTVIEAAHETLVAIGGHVTCAFVFVSADYRPHLADFLELIQLHGHVPMLFGSSASSLVGTAIEAEQASGFSLLFLHLPETTLHTVELHAEQFEAATPGPADWHRITGTREVDTWLVLADPTTFPIEGWLKHWNQAYPNVPTIGGLASGGTRGDDIFLFHNRSVIEGALLIGLQGGIKIHAVVSQGCRPIGEPFTITGAEQNFVTSLGSRPAYEILQETFEALPDADKPLAQGNIFAGLAMSEYVEEFKTGDFLIRNLLGADPEHGLIALGAYPRMGQTLQFQLRDRRSADAELRHLVEECAEEGVKPFASLVFACNGRGSELFASPNHDAAVLSDGFGEHPSAGLFCNGEIGPVGGKSFVHGYTASIALFANP